MRTRTSEQDIFARPAPEAVTYDLSVQDQATIRLPPGSTWTSGPHWHENHDRVPAGPLGAGAGLPLGLPHGSRRTPPTASSFVSRGTVYEWRRSSVEGLDEELVVREWTDPKDGQKELFFRNLNGIILDAVKEATGEEADPDRQPPRTEAGKRELEDAHAHARAQSSLLAHG